MNNKHTTAQRPEDLFGQRVARRLNQAADQLPHDITERLRVARLQALSQLNTSQNVVVQASGAAALQGMAGSSVWVRWGSLVPLLALAASLFAVNMVISDERANELAEIDTALLTDDLPPSAYTDPGFAQFLKSLRD